MASSSSFSDNHSRLPDDTVFYSIFPDSSTSLESLQSLHLEIMQTLTPLISDYIWQHQPFTLSPSSSPIPHLHGHLRFADNLADEWFVVFLLFHLSSVFPNLTIQLHDSDGDFLLIEAAFHLPRWLNPSTSLNRVFLRRANLHIVPLHRFPRSPTLPQALAFLANSPQEDSIAAEAVQIALRKKIAEYPEKALKNTHRVRVRVPPAVAKVLKEEPCLVALAVEGFYDRDIDTMKHAAKMERFLKEEEMVRVSVRMSRAMYAQLAQQAFQAPKCYPAMPSRSGDSGEFAEAEMGMKIACGMEMMYQHRRKEGLEGRGSTWDAFRDSLERSGYFGGLIPGSKEYKRLMENAEEYYRSSASFSRASEMMSAPVKRIDEILASPYSADDFKGVDVPPSDDDSWLYDGEEELNSELLERQKEMELYDLKHKKKHKSKEQDNSGPSSSSNADAFNPGDIAKSMQAFVEKMSSYKGAEVPENRNLKDVDLDVDRFFKDIESMMKGHGGEEATTDDDIEEGSSSGLDFDDSEDEGEGEGAECFEDIEDGEDTFMHSYSDALNEELKRTTLEKSFVRANEQAPKKDEGTSNATEDMDEDFTPVDVDVNLVKSLLDSFSSQQGLPGPASNLLGLMGLQLPHDDKKNGK